MNTKLCITALLSVLILALAANVPRLPSPRYVFKDVEKKDTYSNYQFSTLIYDTWTGEVKYAAEGRFEDKEKKTEPMFLPAGRLLSEGRFPIAIVAERIVLLVAILTLGVAGVYQLSRSKE